MSCWGCAVATVAELRRLAGLRGCDGYDGRRAGTAAGAVRLRRLPMSCWGCGDAPRWGRAWSRSLPAQPKCASVSRETFVRFSIEARRDGIGRENPGGRRRSRARRRYGSARHVSVVPCAAKTSFWHPSVLFSILLVETLQQNPRSRFIEPWECGIRPRFGGFRTGPACQNLVFAAHRLEETREPARRHEATTRRGAIRAAFPEGSPRIPRGARASRKIVRRSPRARATRKVCYYGQVMFSPVPPSVFERYARSRCVKTREGKQAL